MRATHIVTLISPLYVWAYAMRTNTTDVPTQIGREYVESAQLPGEGTRAVKRVARKVAAINQVRYEQIPVPVIWQEDDPYDSFADMRERVKREGVLRVFAGGTHPPHVTHADNVRGRAVHDWFGHLAADVPFDFEGEFRKWAHVRDAYPRDTHAYLFGEVVGQLAAAIYLPDGFDSDRFRQRACLAPDRWIAAAADHVGASL